jgi:hypothetical protein
LNAKATEMSRKRVTVGRRFGDHAGPDEAARAADVLDDDCLVEAPGQFRGDVASDDIVAAARRERDHQLDGLFGITAPAAKRDEEEEGGQQAGGSHRTSILLG